MKVGDLALDEIRCSLAGASGRARFQAAQEIAARLGVSLGHVYRLAKQSTTRALRKDRGERRVEIPEHIADFMRGLTRADFAADHVLFVAARHFGLADDFISAGTYNAWLRQERISRADLQKDLRPARRFESPCANHMHQYDTTVAEAFYANDDDSIGREEKHQRYKNKAGNKKPRLILYSLVDDHSRVIFARFYFSENAVNLLDFCFRAWSQKDDKRFPFYGIPQFFYCDQGSPRRSELFKNAQAKLGFTIPDTTPAHATEFGSRKHGKVERTFGEGLLGEFMKITKIFRFTNIDELNGCLWDWLIRINNRASSSTREVRFERWVKNIGTPRAMPSEEMFALLCYDRTRRTVNRFLQIQLNGKLFQLPYKKPFINWVDAKVEVFWQRGHEEQIRVVYDNHDEELRSLAPVVDIALKYKKVAETERDKKLEALKAQNYSTVNFPQMYAPDKDLPYLPRKGEAFDETRIAEKSVVVPDTRDRNPNTSHEHEPRTRPSLAPERWFSKLEAILELQRRDFFQTPPSAGDREWLASLLGERERIAQTELDGAVILAIEQIERRANGNE